MNTNVVTPWSTIGYITMKRTYARRLNETDLKQKKDSGIGFFTRLEAEIKGVKVITLKTNHRHEIVEPILGLYAEYRD